MKLIGLICFIGVIIIVILASRYQERFTDQKYQLVVARYMESLDWVNMEPYNKFDVIVYNKGNPIQKEGVRVIDTPNVGREAASYLQHIVENYHNLAPVTVFLPGSFHSHHYKLPRALKTCELVLSSGNTVFYGDFVQPDVRNFFADFKIDDYASSVGENRAANPESTLVPAQIRPFGAWYDARFGQASVPVVCYTAIFAVSREHIQQKPVEFYRNLLAEAVVGSSTEVGHYLERAWAAVFFPWPENCAVST